MTLYRSLEKKRGVAVKRIKDKQAREQRKAANGSTSSSPTRFSVVQTNWEVQPERIVR
ncbi:hypothetical protein BDV25DRAFT_151549 [Aspergillus avenaceus]|uniref:Uncharacterized protein n=1 Tax=Aspergillus avenaceus TaxID=36643 RepID=A0A5N6U0L7_ASPAV|nr:hypothetical protein BDV25DRAFT_151549 [Aspergillus avenaceus]